MQTQNKVYKKIYDSQQEQIDDLQKDLLDFISQFNIRTATWSLSIWEKEYGLPVREDLPLDERRGRLLAKKGSKAVFNRKMVENIAKGYNCNLDDFEEFPEHYRFNMVFIDNSMGKTLKSFRASINLYKPAHLKYDMTIGTYNYVEVDTWEEDYGVNDFETELYDDMYITESDIDSGYDYEPIIELEEAEFDYGVNDFSEELYNDEIGVDFYDN